MQAITNWRNTDMTTELTKSNHTERTTYIHKERTGHIHGERKKYTHNELTQQNELTT